MRRLVLLATDVAYRRLKAVPLLQGLLRDRTEDEPVGVHAPEGGAIERFHPAQVLPESPYPCDHLRDRERDFEELVIDEKETFFAQLLGSTLR